MTNNKKFPKAGEIYKNLRGERYICTGHRFDGFSTKFYRMVNINHDSSHDIEMAMPLFAKCFELETQPDTIQELKEIINLQQKQLKIEQKETKNLREQIKKGPKP